MTQFTALVAHWGENHWSQCHCLLWPPPTQVPERPSVRTSEHPNIRAPKHPSIRASERPNIRASLRAMEEVHLLLCPGSSVFLASLQDRSLWETNSLCWFQLIYLLWREELKCPDHGRFTVCRELAVSRRCERFSHIKSLGIFPRTEFSTTEHLLILNYSRGQRQSQCGNS